MGHQNKIHFSFFFIEKSVQIDSSGEKKVEVDFFLFLDLTLKLPEHLENRVFLALISVCTFVMSLPVIYWLPM